MDGAQARSQDELVDQTAHSLVVRYVDELPDYQRIEHEDLLADVAPTCCWHSRTVLAALGTHYQADPRIFRNSAIRRFYQGIPVQSLVKSYEIWAMELWERYLNSPNVRGDAGETLQFSTILNRHVETATSAATKTYIDESSGRSSDREELRPDLLRELISTDEASNFIDRLTVALRMDLDKPHAVILVRPREPDSANKDTVQKTLKTTRHIVAAGNCDPAVSGVHGRDVVAICTLRQDKNYELLRAANSLAQALPDVLVGVSRSYFSKGGFAHGYLEAQNSIIYASTRGERRAHSFSDALVNRILRQSELTEELRRETIGPVAKYDLVHTTELLITLQTYADANFNLKRSAAMLHVQPNTVRYRLQRIHNLTGHDPLTSQGIFVLLAGLRLIEPRS